MKMLVAAVLMLSLFKGCTPIERTAYNTVVGSKAFLGSVKEKHPECPATVSTICVDLAKATAAKDLLIDVGEVYCSDAAFESNGGPCHPPAKGTPMFDQAVAKLKAALAGYSQAETDLRGVL